MALAKRRSSQGRVVGHLLVPLCCKSAGELVSVNGEVDARSVAGKSVDLLCSECGVPWELVGRSGSHSPWQVGSGKCGSESLSPYVRYASVAWREVYMRLSVGQGWRDGVFFLARRKGECGGLCPGVRVCVDVGRAPAKVVVQASASPSGV